jgi:hypothetical protein
MIMSSETLTRRQRLTPPPGKTAVILLLAACVSICTARPQALAQLPEPKIGEVVPRDYQGLPIERRKLEVAGFTEETYLDYLKRALSAQRYMERELAAAGKVKPKIETYPLAKVNEVRERLAAGKVRYRAVLQHGG